MPRSFNDTLALFLVLLVFISWYLFKPSDLVLGATIAWVGQIVTFYFRKAPPP